MITLASVLLLGVPVSLCAQAADAAGPSVAFERPTLHELEWTPSEPALATVPARADTTVYRKNHWRTGALVGAVVGVALGTLILTACDSDSSQDCPGWGRAGIALVGSTGVGALVGAFIPKRSEAPVPSGQE